MYDNTLLYTSGDFMNKLNCMDVGFYLAMRHGNMDFFLFH